MLLALVEQRERNLMATAEGSLPPRASSPLIRIDNGCAPSGGSLRSRDTVDGNVREDSIVRLLLLPQHVKLNSSGHGVG